MTRSAGILAAALLAAAPGAAQVSNTQRTLLADAVSLRGLDTLNGTVRDIELRVGETARFGNLEITADTCRVPENAPGADAYVFLRIRDVREDAPRFSGWMFASSPALSALDHPRYDVWVLGCRVG